MINKLIFNSSFSQALSHQSKHFDSSLHEIKQLLVLQSKRKQPAEQDDQHQCICKSFFVSATSSYLQMCFLGLLHMLGTWGRNSTFCYASRCHQSFVCRESPMVWPCICSRSLPTNGVRFGEASNPGPTAVSPGQTIALGLCNPTVLQSKEDTISNLMMAFKCDVLTLSETAATGRTQKHFQRHMQAKGCHMLWSPPAEPIRNTISTTEHHRGQASGVAVVSHMPIRLCRNPQPTSWECSTRILHAVLRIGNTAIQIITLPVL